MRNRPALFPGWHFEDVIIILCVRWYLRYSLSYRDLEEIMAERGPRHHLAVGPALCAHFESAAPNRSWRVDETYVRVAGKLDLPLPGSGFGWRHHRFYVVAQ